MSAIIYSDLHFGDLTQPNIHSNPFHEMKQLLHLRQVCTNPKSPAITATEPCMLADIFKKIVAVPLPPQI
jgi:hypothetical protein